jgi:LytTr DNA-binding domain
MNAPLTGGWEGVTESGRREASGLRFPWFLWLAYAAMLAAVAAVGATSFWMEAGRSGAAVPFWPLAVDEATSVVTVLALTPLVFAWTARLHPGRVGWPKALAAHLAGVLAFTILHIAGMMALRFLVYSLFASPDGFGIDPLVDTLIYESRKDALTYAALAGGAWLLSAALRKVADRTERTIALPRLEIRDGARRTFLDPAEILWAEAAGNYVELHLPGRTLLRRQTLATLERELADMHFVRIHRSRLVNAQHVTGTESNDSGDFAVTLRDGRQIAGSRRWRRAMERLAGGGAGTGMASEGLTSRPPPIP